MELINLTRMVAGYNIGLEPSGRELLVVVVKGTFRMPTDGGPAQLAEEQAPLVMADTFAGSPGSSAPVYEADFAAIKPRCDVLLIGSAHAPGGRPTARMSVGMRVDRMLKGFTVVGDRHWQCRLSGISATEPQPFTLMAVSYDRAFGGVDKRHPEPSRHAAFMRNPVGRGFHKHLRPEWVEGSPLPNTEAFGESIDRADSTEYQPMAFGVVGRGWDPRYKYAGTYDALWLERQFPFLPTDFDTQFYQAAPRDQQIPYPRGGEEVRLINLMEEGEVAFTLPVFDATIQFYSKHASREDATLKLDTILFEPDQHRVMLTWRAVRPLQNSIREVVQTVVGRRPRVLWASPAPVVLPVSPTP